MKLWKIGYLEKRNFGKMEIGHQEKWYFGKIDVWKNGNLEELKFEKINFQKCKF